MSGNRLTREYFKDVTVMSWDAESGMLTTLGSGSLTYTQEKIESTALMDTHKQARPGMLEASFTGEFVVEKAGTKWWMKMNKEADLIVQTPSGNFAGPFMVTSAAKSLEDANKWNVTLESTGDCVPT